MRVVRKGIFNNTKIVLYDSIKELSSERYHEFQKLVIKDLEIGDDIQSVFKHFSKFKILLTSETVDQAHQELKNIFQTFFFLIQGISVKSYCFAALVDEINGFRVTSLDEESVQRVIREITRCGLKEYEVIEIVEDVKKNLSQNLEPSFLIDILLAE